MTGWNKVTWSSGSQVLVLAGHNAAGASGDTRAALPPDAYCNKLIADGNLDAATDFIAHALPRYEAVVWATQVLRNAEPGQDEMLTSVLRWIDEPDDARRREIHDRATALRRASALQLLGLAVFYSGGSMSEPDLPAVLPPPDACAKCAAGAVLKTAYSSTDPAATLRDALRIGDSIARGNATA